jgi:hypothetical protein
VSSLEVGKKLGINVVYGSVGLIEELNAIFVLVGYKVGLNVGIPVGSSVGSSVGACVALTVGFTVSLILGLDVVSLLGVKASNPVRSMASLSSLSTDCLFPLDAVTTIPIKHENTSTIEKVTITWYLSLGFVCNSCNTRLVIFPLLPIMLILPRLRLKWPLLLAVGKFVGDASRSTSSNIVASPGDFGLAPLAQSPSCTSSLTMDKP